MKGTDFMTTLPKKVHQAEEALFSRLAYTLLWMDKIIDSDWDEELTVLEFRVKAPSVEGGDFMVIVKAASYGNRLVMFNSASSPSEAIAGAVAKIRQKDSSIWREDKPFGTR